MHTAPLTVYEGDDPSELKRIALTLEKHEIRFYKSSGTYVGHFEYLSLFPVKTYRSEGFKIVVSPNDESTVRELFKDLYLSRKLSMDITLYDKISSVSRSLGLFLTSVFALSGFHILLQKIIEWVRHK